MHRIVPALMILALTVAATGCGKLKLRMPTLSQPVPVEEPVEPGRWTPYPGEAELGADWDIIVLQGKESIRLNNQTPRTYSDVQVWVNQQYVADVATIKIGPGNRVPLASLVNEHGETYPIPGFLTPDHAFPAVLCEIFDPADGKRHRLLSRVAP